MTKTAPDLLEVIAANLMERIIRTTNSEPEIFNFDQISDHSTLIPAPETLSS